MAQAVVSNEALVQDPEQQKPKFDVTFTGFLTYKAPFDKPTLELKYELDYSLSDIINTFRTMVFEDLESLPDDLKELVRFSKRKMTFDQKSTGKSGEFQGNDAGNECEVLKFETTVLPLIPGFNAKEYEKKMKEKQAEQQKQGDNAADQSGWSSWTSASSWKDWGKSMVDPQAWGNSMEGWLKYFNMSMQAEELWKVDWIQHKAMSLVKNITMSWTVGVYEYSEIEQLMHIADGKSENVEENEEQKNENESNEKKGDRIVFIKKLYVWPIVPVPGFVLDILKDQYTKDSELQMQIIKKIIEKPLKKDADEALDQLE